MLKVDPTKSNRQVAKLTKTSHPHVAKVRDRLEQAGDVETVTTSVDTKGREQPAHKPPPRRGESHVCWQCKTACGETPICLAKSSWVMRADFRARLILSPKSDAMSGS